MTIQVIISANDFNKPLDTGLKLLILD